MRKFLQIDFCKYTGVCSLSKRKLYCQIDGVTKDSVLGPSFEKFNDKVEKPI